MTTYHGHSTAVDATMGDVTHTQEEAPVDDDVEQVRHFEVTFEDGATVTLPAEAWLDQALVRSMLGAIRGREPTWMNESDWQGFVWSIADRHREDA